MGDSRARSRSPRREPEFQNKMRTFQPANIVPKAPTSAASAAADPDVDPLDAFMDGIGGDLKKAEKKVKKKLKKEGLEAEAAAAAASADQFEMFRARASKVNEDVDGLDDDNCAKMTGGSAEWKRMSRRVHGLD